MSMKPALIIGLGTGACGSVSLARFLRHQPSFAGWHEGLESAWPYRHYLLPWEPSAGKLAAWKSALLAKSAASGAAYVFDVASYFLPYVPLLASEESFEQVSFLCLKRPMDQVVRSFMRKTWCVNHWIDHGGRGWLPDPVWDPVHPKFEASGKSEALRMYWRSYYEKAEQYQSQYPGRFQIADIEILNSSAGRAKLLELAGYHGPSNLEQAFFENRSRGGIANLAARIVTGVYHLSMRALSGSHAA